jgi:hypothetical protein
MAKLWVDDVREPPDDSWVWVKNYIDAILQIALQDFEVISLDHDLACYYDGKEYTGYAVLLFMVYMKEARGYKFVNVKVHSMNPVGRQKMIETIEKYLA